jgi:hypothetical protein
MKQVGLCQSAGTSFRFFEPSPVVAPIKESPRYRKDCIGPQSAGMATLVKPRKSRVGRVVRLREHWCLDTF